MNVLFTYEEALGYCLGDVVCDKDGVSAAPVMAELAGYLWANRSMTVLEYLQSLYAIYGEFVSYNSYVICRDPIKTDAIFRRIRTGGPGDTYFPEVAGSRVVAVKDVTTGFNSDLPLTPDSHMIMFDFDNGVTATLRTSGTEPKIKFYTEIAGAPGIPRETLEHQLHAFVDQMVDELLQPKQNGL